MKTGEAMTGILCRQLGFHYGTHRALAGLDLVVPPGEIYGLLGPNGAGKTTTLKLLVGLLQPQTGEARVAGHDLAGASQAARRAVAYVPDKPFLYERLTAWEYLELVAGLWELADEAAWRRRAQAELERFGLAENGEDLLESYSLGMRQKMLIIAGLIHEPSVWILDEPMSGLDPRSCRMMRDLLQAEAARGAAVLLSTHTLDTAERLCHRVGIIDHGRLVAEGTLADLQKLAGSECGRLEELFLELTEEG